MHRDLRMQAILDLLGEAGTIEVADIVETLGVSAATARRDLDALADRRLLSRTHGGAVQDRLNYDLPLRFKRGHRATQKDAIAAAAQQFIHAGSIVGLTGGTTSSAIAQRLAGRTSPDEGGNAFSCTVVTNAINIAAQLAIRPNIRLLATGGFVQANSYELVGGYAELVLDELALDVAFIGINGLDAEFGPSVHDELEARVNRRMAERARDAYLVADSSKIGTRAFARMGSWANYRALITDEGIDMQQREFLNDAGLSVVIAA